MSFRPKRTCSKVAGSGKRRNPASLTPCRVPAHEGSYAGTIWLSIALLLFALAGNGIAQVSNMTESRVKAVYILNFLRFISWPDSSFVKPEAPLVVGIVGGGAFAKTLDSAMSSEKIGEHPILVRSLSSPAESGSCQAVFIPSDEAVAVAPVLKATSGQCILTIGGKESFAASGVIIDFFLESNHLRFEVNMKALKKSGLKMSSKLLRLARIIDAV